MDELGAGEREKTLRNPKSGEPFPVLRWGWLRAVLMLVCLLAAELVAGVLFSPLLQPIKANAGAYGTLPYMLLAQFVIVLVMWGVVWFFRRTVDRKTMVTLGFKWRKPYRQHLLDGLLWGFGIISAVFIFLRLSGAIEIVSISFPTRTVFLGLALCSMVAVGEELIIRGYVLQNLMASMSPFVALPLSALPFALAHASNPNASVEGILNIVFAGLALGIYYIHRRNLWFPIGMHLAWNFCEGFVYGSPVSGLKVESIIEVELTGPKFLTGGEFGFEASVAALVVLLIATYIIHRVYRYGRPAHSSRAAHLIDAYKTSH